MRVEGREGRKVRLYFPSHPLQPKLDVFLCQPCVSFLLVISMRCMVQFVGREVKYRCVAAALKSLGTQKRESGSQWCQMLPCRGGYGNPGGLGDQKVNLTRG